MRVDPEKCRGCKLCLRYCRYKAITMEAGVASIGLKCVGCGVCESACVFGAISQ